MAATSGTPSADGGASRKKGWRSNKQRYNVKNKSTSEQLLTLVALQSETTTYVADMFLNLKKMDAAFDGETFQTADGQNGGRIPRNWVLLDTGSTVSVYYNAKLMVNIHWVKVGLRINTQAGTTTTNLKGTVPGYGEVWYTPKGIANILSLGEVKVQRDVEYDSKKGDQFEVTARDGSKKIFKRSAHGLYYFDMTPLMGRRLSQGAGATSLLSTVALNKAKYTVSDCQRAEKARAVQRIIARPSTARYKELVRNNRIPHCDVTVQDIINAEDIFGPDVGSLKGKTVRRAPDQVRAGGLVPLPAMIKECYRKLVLSVDIMKLNGMPFLITMNSETKFGTVNWLKDAKTTTIMAALKTVNSIYVKRGFVLEVVAADGQFEPTRDALAEMGITLNKCSREEHVPVAERRVRTLKE